MNVTEKFIQRITDHFRDGNLHFGASHVLDSGFSPDETTWAHFSNSLSQFFRRNAYVFAMFVPLAIILGAAYIFLATPAYTARAVIVIDTHKEQLFQTSQTNETTIDATNAVLTQIEVVKSTKVTWGVVKQLNLMNDPELTRPGVIGSAIRFVARSVGLDIGQDENSKKQALLTAFDQRRAVARVGLTSAIEVSFRAQDPDRAAQIANAIANEFVEVQLEGKYEAARRASDWMQGRIEKIRLDMTAAENAVVEFKAKHNIVDTGGVGSDAGQGRLINEQQLSELNTQLILAGAATAEAKARFDRIHQLMSQDLPDASVTDALKSEVIIKLRGEYLELAQRERIISQKYGENHLASIGIRSQMEEIRHSIADEMRKIAESYESDYEIARTREASIRTSLDNVIGNSHGANLAQVKLRDLLSNAQTTKSEYENLLRHYNDAVQQQSFPISDAGVISPAEPPDQKSWPDPLIVLLASTAGGFLVACGISAAREDTHKVFRTGRQIADVLDANCLAIVPKLTCVPFDDADDESLTGQHYISKSAGLLRYATNAPLSQFTESLRSLKVSADLRNRTHGNKVIGFTSSLPHEGKSTISANFAAMIAQGGSRVVLVDGDLRRATLSGRLAPGSSTGLTDIIAGRETLEGAVWKDPSTDLLFLPAGANATAVLHPNDLLGSQKMEALIDKLRDKFDYVVVDFPPLAAVADTRATTTFIDSYVYVIEWGVTKTDLVKQDLSRAREIYEMLLGVVLNKVDLDRLGQYEPNAENYYERYRSTAPPGARDVTTNAMIPGQGSSGKSLFLVMIAIMAMRAITLVVRFALTIFIAQLMGLSDLGFFGLALATVAIAPVLFGFGLSGPLVRRVVDLGLSNALPLVWTLFVFTAGSYCLILPVAWAFNSATGFLPMPLSVLLGLIVFLEHESQNIHNLLVAKDRPAFAASLMFVRGGLWPTLFMGLAFQFPGLRSTEALFQFWILGLIAPFLILIGFLAVNGRWRHIRLLKAAWLKEHLPNAYRFYLQDVAYAGYQVADRFIVAKFLGLEATGVYTFFWSIANAVYSLINNGITAPYFSKLTGAATRGDVKAFRYTAARLQLTTCCWSIAIAICFLAAMPLLLERLHRPQLIENIWVFWIVMSAIVLRMISENYSLVLYAASQDRRMAAGTLFGLAVAIISTAILTPLYGLGGVSAACLGTSAVMLYTRYWLTRPLLG